MSSLIPLGSGQTRQENPNRKLKTLPRASGEHIAQINVVFICAPNNKGSTEEGLLTWSKKINGQN